ncbi:39526_t:CDS:2, partial [Gigaspora margarita]
FVVEVLVLKVLALEDLVLKALSSRNSKSSKAITNKAVIIKPIKLIKAMPKIKPEAIKVSKVEKTAVQLLKELGYSDLAMMSITRHKFQKGLAVYEYSKSVMQHKVFLFDTSGDHNNNEASSNYDDGKAPHDHKAPSGYKNSKNHYKVVPITGDFVFATKHNQNILEKDGQKNEIKGVKMDGQKKKNKGIEENLKNK